MITDTFHFGSGFMSINRGFVERHLRRVVEKEENTILHRLYKVDNLFLKAQPLNSPNWTAERYRIFWAEIDRAAAKMMSEIRRLAGQDAPNFAKDVSIGIEYLGRRLINHYREKPWGDNEALRAAILEIKDRTLGDLSHGPTPSVAAPLGDRDVAINAGSSVAVGGREFSQNAESSDVPALLATLSEVRQAIEDSEIRSVVLRNLIDDLAAIEALAQQLKPDHSRLRRMLTRLEKSLKYAAVPVAARIAEAYLKERRVVVVGLPDGRATCSLSRAYGAGEMASDPAACGRTCPPARTHGRGSGEGAG
jgi:hypothetical protein